MNTKFLKRKKDDEKNTQKNKDIEYYSACVNGWINIKLERDKSLLTLSSSGIAVMVTLLTTVGVNPNNYTSTAISLFYFLALLSFLICIIYIVKIFESNANHLEKIISKDLNDDDSVLTKYDLISKRSFISGIIFSFLIGVLSTDYSSTLLEKLMKNNNETTQNKNQKSGYVGGSFANLGKLAPKNSNPSTQQTQNSTQKK